MVNTAKASDRDALVRVLEPVVAGHGLDLEDVTVTPAGRRRLLRVVVDRDGGLDLDAVAEVSTSVSAALDESQVMGATAYVLEVTSPGVDRPLTLPRHWRRAATRLVKVTRSDGGSLVGRVKTAGDHDVTLDVDGTPRRLGYDEVAVARVQVEFARKAPADREAEEEAR